MLWTYWNAMKNARQTLFDEGYREAGKAVGAVHDECVEYLGKAPNHTMTTYIGNILGRTHANIDGIFDADTPAKVPPRWKNADFLRGYHARLQEELQTKFVRITLTDNKLPRGCIEVSVQGTGRGQEAGNVVAFRQGDRPAGYRL